MNASAYVEVFCGFDKLKTRPNVICFYDKITSLIYFL